MNDLLIKPHYFFYYYQEVFLDGFLYLQAKQSQIKDKAKFDKIATLVKHDLPTFPLTGDDIMSQLSLKPGKKLGKALELAKNFWIESEFKANKASILTHINNIFT